MDWRRHVLGGLGLLAFSLGVARLIATGGDFGETWASMGMRIGVILIAVWLALPQVRHVFSRVPLWLLVTVLIGFFFAMRNARLIPIIAIFIALIVGLKVAGRMLGLINSPDSLANLRRGGRVVENAAKPTTLRGKPSDPDGK